MTDRLSLPTVDIPDPAVSDPPVGRVDRLRAPVLTRRRGAGLAAVAVLLAGFAVKSSEVDDRLTDDDRRYAALILAEAGVQERPTLGDFGSEVAFVRAVQAAVLHVAPVSATETGIPQGQAREPADLYRERRGLCFDRSRVIEKILRAYGLRTRHVSAFHGTSGSTSAWVLFDPHTRSHALTEVATSRGWMLADSNSVYVALGKGKELPMGATAVARGAKDPSAPQLDEPAPAGTFFATPFLPIRGLYSRHGRFFAPYNAIPDVAWSEMLSFDLRQLPGYPVTPARRSARAEAARPSPAAPARSRSRAARAPRSGSPGSARRGVARRRPRVHAGRTARLRTGGGWARWVSVARRDGRAVRRRGGGRGAKAITTPGGPAAIRSITPALDVIARASEAYGGSPGSRRVCGWPASC